MTWSHDMVTFKMITLLLGVQARATKYYEMGGMSVEKSKNSMIYTKGFYQLRVCIKRFMVWMFSRLAKYPQNS